MKFVMIILTDTYSLLFQESKHKRTDRSILCCLRKGESGQAWPRLTKERAKVGLDSVIARAAVPAASPGF